MTTKKTKVFETPQVKVYQMKTSSVICASINLHSNGMEQYEEEETTTTNEWY